MKESAKSRLRRLTRNAFDKIEKSKRRLNGRELSNTISDPESKLISKSDIELALNNYQYIKYINSSDKDKEVINHLLSKLSQPYFDIVTMYFYERKRMWEIANIYDKDKSWVSRKLQEAYEIMRGLDLSC